MSHGMDRSPIGVMWDDLPCGIKAITNKMMRRIAGNFSHAGQIRPERSDLDQSIPIIVINKAQTICTCLNVSMICACFQTCDLDVYVLCMSLQTVMRTPQIICAV